MSEYTVLKDHRTGTWEVVRWGTFRDRTTVQSNIQTREKALQACGDWIQRERDANAKPD